MADQEVVAAIISAVLTAHQRTASADVAEAVKTYHACLDALQHFADVPPEARWSAAAEHQRLTGSPGEKG
jgi:hypothetical protein